jgi:hypothetical protein
MRNLDYGDRLLTQPFPGPYTASAGRVILLAVTLNHLAFEHGPQVVANTGTRTVAARLVCRARAVGRPDRHTGVKPVCRR